MVHHNNRFPRAKLARYLRCAALGIDGEQHLADIPPFLEITVCSGGCSEWEGLGNDRADLLLCIQLYQGLHRLTQQIRLVPQTTKMDTDHRLVLTDQAQGMKPGHAEEVPESHPAIAAHTGTHTGGTKQEQAAKGSQHLITLRKGAPTQGIEDNIEPTATGESVDDHRQIMMVIVDRMVHALRLQKGMFDAAAVP